ncbi:MAG: endolytic transglycosylase MltG [Thermoleophilia bacterium]
MSSSRRRPPARGRRRRASGRRTLLWLVLILLMVGAVGWAVTREVDRRDDDAEQVATTQAPPIARFLVREGLRREDVAALLGEETPLSPERYLALTAPGSRGRALAGTDGPTSLEGFLFPATYDIGPDTTPADLVDEQVEAYRQNTAAVDYSYAESRNLTRYDVLIIASMIEREVQVANERRIVASVIYNRLKQGMRLDIDATVQYAIGAWKTELTAGDLAVDSPYNTRRFTGLPPGPIASPGIASIQAAANPARTDYLYYVARNDGTGGHYFARTSEQFERDVQRSRANAG